MKGLATQAANDTFSATERTLIAKQIQSLGYDINDIADSTKFNGIALNPSGGDTTLTFQTGEGTSDTYTFNLRRVDVLHYLVMQILIRVGAAGDIVSVANVSAY